VWDATPDKAPRARLSTRANAGSIPASSTTEYHRSMLIAIPLYRPWLGYVVRYSCGHIAYVAGHYQGGRCLTCGYGGTMAIAHTRPIPGNRSRWPRWFG
jgi:hypothetical protein